MTIPPARCAVCGQPDGPHHAVEEIKNPARSFLANETCAILAGWWTQHRDYDYIPEEP